MPKSKPFEVPAILIENCIGRGYTPAAISLEQHSLLCVRMPVRFALGTYDEIDYKTPTALVCTKCRLIWFDWDETPEQVLRQMHGPKMQVSWDTETSPERRSEALNLVAAGQLVAHNTVEMHCNLTPWSGQKLGSRKDVEFWKTQRHVGKNGAVYAMILNDSIYVWDPKEQRGR